MRTPADNRMDLASRGLALALAPAASGIRQAAKAGSMFGGLRARLMLLVGAALVPAILLILYMAAQQYREARVQTQHAALRMVRVAAADHAKQLGNARRMLAALLTMENTPGSGHCPAGPSSILLLGSGFIDLQLIDASGKRLCAWPANTAPASAAEVAVAHQTIEKQRFQTGGYEFLASKGHAEIHLAYPSQPIAGMPQSALVLSYDLSFLGDLIRNSDLPAGTAITITDRDGLVRYRFPEPELWAGKRIADSQIVQGIIGHGQEGVVELDGFDDVPRLYAFAPLSFEEGEEALHIHVGIPSALAYQDVMSTLRVALVSLGVVSVIVFALLWVGGNALIGRPIDALTAAAKQLGGGDYGARSRLKSAAGEFHQLSTVFDSMAEALQKNQFEVEQLEFAMNQHAIVSIAGVDGKIILVNDKFVEASQYSRAELLGQDHRMLSSGFHPKPFFAYMWECLTSGLVWQGTVRNRRKDGSYYWVATTIVPRPAALGQPEQYICISTDVTSLQETRTRLQQGETLFRGLTETAAVGIVVHRGDKPLYVNPAICRMTGFSKAELLSRSHLEVLHPECHDEARQRVAARLRGERLATSFDVRMQTRSGEELWAQVSAAGIEYQDQPTIIATFVDITARIRAETSQRDSNEILKHIVQGSPIATFVVDAAHQVTHWNHACEALSGQLAKEVVGTCEPWRAFYEKKRPVLADLIVSGASEIELKSLYQDKYCRSKLIESAYEVEDFFPQLGEGGRWLHFTAAPLRNSVGCIIGAIQTLQDVSLQKTTEASLMVSQVDLEQEVQQRTAQLATAKDLLEADVRRRELTEKELLSRNADLTTLNRQLGQAQEQLLQSEKMASVGQLAAGVAHEINNPIGYVHSNLGALENYLGDLFKIITAYEQAEITLQKEHESAKALQRVKQSLDLEFLKEDVPSLLSESKEGINRVRVIVQNLKDFSRVDSTQEWQFASLHDGLDSTLNVATNEIKYRADICKSYGSIPDIECLPSQLNQVFLNLLVNAAQAIEGPRGTITLRTGSAQDEVWVEVADTGKGIAPENLSRVFDPFFTTKPVGKGTGLGLSLSYGIVQKHNGRIEVTSAPGKGTTFRVILPVHQPGRQDAAQAGQVIERAMAQVSA